MVGQQLQLQEQSGVWSGAWRRQLHAGQAACAVFKVISWSAAGYNIGAVIGLSKASFGLEHPVDECIISCWWQHSMGVDGD